MENRELGKRLNDQIADAAPNWRQLDFVDYDPYYGGAPAHRALSQALTILGEVEPVWVSAEVNFEEWNQRPVASFTVMLWTDDILLTVAHKPSEQWPVTIVRDRHTLTGLKVLKAPNLTANPMESHDRRLEIELTYPDLTVVLTDRNAEALQRLIPSFVADLTKRDS